MSLKNKLIRFAYENPEHRDEILPLLKEAGPSWDDYSISPWKDPRRPGTTRLPDYLEYSKAGAGINYVTKDRKVHISSFHGGPWIVYNRGPGVSRPLKTQDWNEVIAWLDKRYKRSPHRPRY